MEKQDQELMFEYQKGRVEAFEELFLRYKFKILNFALRILCNRADAEDVTSDVFATLFRKKHSYKPKAKFSTWLFTIARNFCISRIRKRNRMVSMWFSQSGSDKEEQWEPEDTKDIPSEEIKKREAAEMVRAAINNLPYSQKEALVLREYHDFSYADIANILNCSLEQVKVLIFRGRERLRAELSPLLTEENNG